MSKFNTFVVPSDRVNEHHAQPAGSWWTAYATAGTPHDAFYQEARRQDVERFSRQPREVPVFTDQRFGPITGTRAGVPALDAI